MWFSCFTVYLTELSFWVQMDSWQYDFSHSKHTIGQVHKINLIITQLTPCVFGHFLHISLVTISAVLVCVHYRGLTGGKIEFLVQSVFQFFCVIPPQFRSNMLLNVPYFALFIWYLLFPSLYCELLNPTFTRNATFIDDKKVVSRNYCIVHRQYKYVVVSYYHIVGIFTTMYQNSDSLKHSEKYDYVV